MTTQAERTLQSEVMLRLRAGAWPVIALPVPNSIFFPARNDQERSIIRRVIAQMKAAGFLVPGAPDIVLLWRGGGGMIELKRPASRDLLGKRTPAGRPSVEQQEMAEIASILGVPHAYCTSWDEVRGRLIAWGAPQPGEARRELDAMLEGLPNDTLDDMIDAEARR